MGRQNSLAKAESLLAELSATEAGEDAGRFEVTQIHVESGSPYVGATLMDLKFRQTFGVTVIGVNRGEKQITTPGPDFQLETGDCVVVIGTGNAVEALKERRLLSCAVIIQ
jgi:K+/H+ antiporter YhaU regulatory subunit KhtT